MFIGSSTEGLNIVKAGQSNLWRDVVITTWPKAFSATKNTLEELAALVDKFDFAVFVLSRDDVSTIRKETVPVVRDNVIFEAGMFVGRLGRERVFLLTPHDDEKLHLPTDLLGTTTLVYDAQRPDGNLGDATQPACMEIEQRIKEFGGIRASKGVVAYDDNIVITTFDGSYVQVEADEKGTLKANSKEFCTWDKFSVVSATGAVPGRSVKFGDKIGLKSLKNNQFAGVNHNAGYDKAVAAWVPKLNDWETFIIRPANSIYADGNVVPYGASFALFCDPNNIAEKSYVAYKPTDTQAFWAAAAQIGDWERLRFVEPEKA